MLDVARPGRWPPRDRLIVKHTTRTVKAIVRDLHYRLDVNTLHRDESAQRAAG